MLSNAPDGLWWLVAGRCTATRHLRLAEGPLSLLISCVEGDDRTHDQAIQTFAAIGNRRAWWCYACGAWGVSHAPIRRPWHG